ncbi:UDP-N-acetylmuramoylalanyl-D-glutamyl-2,6-diaminopimelate--D-alanyl-D-alanine ligase [Limoniibacter endophyticus]|uniref:UDP-N-acetylmuramoyl-tripeptide--D-alanyl-D-alanine ligase n=1 Tax=Limoniibacter endophyticus TaxID=1565040 RepID=A0A8J3DJQ5_9HYPH|nr:UDP-N-acetylmuramoylalanyl-D-glutamyl-2,6-diaminopimelate--D-alanyl-D-alanine ligase [Limoniibacter endophyticus]GHC75170.1 UDP-N-acetylmuramoyl-tripeptide--D-alanyl-D-alanine ligase [Limoniibacter endophyticus]
MSISWNSDAFVEIMGGRPFGNLPSTITGVSIDTRTLQKGEAFFAIKGDRFDGHNFATAAIGAGAGVMVIAEHKLPALGRFNIPMIVVPDVLVALEKVAAAARIRSRAKVIAITGSAGKTSTKEALRHVLSEFGTVHAADKSFNNHWGVPLTLARLPDDADFAIVEIGMNHPGEIRPLVKLAQPHIAVITLIAAAHLGHFSGLDEIARAKAEIFEGIVPGGYALLNRDDQRWKLLDELATEARVRHVLGFGENARAHVRLTDCRLGSEHSDIRVALDGKEIDARVGAPGRHVVQNMLAVLGCAQLLSLDIEKAANALGNLRPEEGRGRRHRLRIDGEIATLIDESYNANPASMRAALDVLRTATVGEGGRRIAVLGDMLELGSHAPKLHAGLAEFIIDKGIDLVLLAGDEMTALADVLTDKIAVEYRPDANALEPVLLDTVRGGDAVMIKSSKSSGFSKLVETLVNRYGHKTPA